MEHPMGSSSTQAKNYAFRSMLLMGQVRVWFDRSYKGVLVPEALRARPRRDLAYTPDMCPDITDIGISVTILYGGEAFKTFVPWRAVYRMTSPLGNMTWVDHAPAEVRDNMDPDLDDEKAEYRDAQDGALLLAMGLAAAATGPTMSVPVAEPSTSPEQPSNVGASRPDHAEGASSSPAVSARASSPDLKVISGGGGVDSGGGGVDSGGGGVDSEGEDFEG
jgi:hypothetical protein